MNSNGAQVFSSAELKTDGTRIVHKENPEKSVRLMGVNACGLEYDLEGDMMIKNRVEKALDLWNANVLRLPVSSEFWFGRSKEQNGNYEDYRKLVDELVEMVSQRGKHVVLDLHGYVAPKEIDINFWKNAAVRYGNHPAVLFGLFNEPHDVSWEIWRKGGIIEEEGEEITVYGFQRLIEIIRDTGANNILLISGLDWGYELTGILENGGLLVDRKTDGGLPKEGNGIVYDTHIYPMKKGLASWEKNVKPMRSIAPVIVGEWGWDPNDLTVLGTKEPVIEPEEIERQSLAFEMSLLEWMDLEGNDYGPQMHWVAWVLHEKATPKLITDSTTCGPTSYHGKYVYNKLKRTNIY